MASQPITFERDGQTWHLASRLTRTRHGVTVGLRSENTTEDDLRAAGWVPASESASRSTALSIGSALKRWRPDSRFEVAFIWDLTPDRSTKHMRAGGPTLDTALRDLFDDQGFSAEEKARLLAELPASCPTVGSRDAFAAANDALRFLNGEAWAHVAYGATRRRYLSDGKGWFTIEQCIAFARDLGWEPPASIRTEPGECPEGESVSRAEHEAALENAVDETKVYLLIKLRLEEWQRTVRLAVRANRAGREGFAILDEANQAAERIRCVDDAAFPDTKSSSSAPRFVQETADAFGELGARLEEETARADAAEAKLTEQQSRIEEEETRAAEWMETADQRLREISKLTAKLTEQQAEHERVVAELQKRLTVAVDDCAFAVNGREAEGARAEEARTLLTAQQAEHASALAQLKDWQDWGFSMATPPICSDEELREKLGSVITRRCGDPDPAGNNYCTRLLGHLSPNHWDNEGHRWPGAEGQIAALTGTLASLTAQLTEQQAEHERKLRHIRQAAKGELVEVDYDSGALCEVKELRKHHEREVAELRQMLTAANRATNEVASRLVDVSTRLTTQEAEHERVVAARDDLSATLTLVGNERDALKQRMEKWATTGVPYWQLNSHECRTDDGVTCVLCQRDISGLPVRMTEQVSSASSGDIEAEAAKTEEADTVAESKPWRDPDWKPKVGDRVEHYDRRRGVITATPSRLLRNSCDNADVLFDGGREQEVWLSSIRPEPAQPATGGTERWVPKVGDVVRGSARKPRGCFDGSGAVIEIFDSSSVLPIHVKWDNGSRGNYAVVELEHMPDPTPSPALPVGQGEDRPVMLSELVEALETSGNGPMKWLARELAGLERKGGES